MAGRHYLEKQGKTPGVPEEELIRTAVLSLGLNDVSEFDPDKKIIERQFKETGKTLVSLDLRTFANEVSMDSPAPGGGSVAALCGALSAALSSMVANLTYGKKGYEESGENMKRVAVRAQELLDELLRAVDLDTRAFNRVMEAFRLPKGTEEQNRERESAVEEASKGATLVPLGVLAAAAELVELADVVARKGNRNSLSDAGVAGLTAQAAGEGAYYNVRINLPGIKDERFRTRTVKQAEALRRKLGRGALALKKHMENALK
jgi:glutamate formiminotransferase/formiminotetrahydrofolate cyclodeaminase